MPTFNRNTRVIDLTVADFETLLKEYIFKGKLLTPEELSSVPSDETIRGLKNIAAVLGISEKTLHRWRKEKIIGSPVIRQIGGVITAKKSDLLNFKKQK